MTAKPPRRRDHAGGGPPGAIAAGQRCDRGIDKRGQGAPLMLTNPVRRFLDCHLVGHLARADSRAIPHVVPICFAIWDATLYSTIDEKPKRNPSAPLQRVRNIAENPAAAVVVDRYHDNWAKLGWVMLRGPAEILSDGTEHNSAQALLRAVSPIGGNGHRGLARDRCPYPKRGQLGRSDDRTDERVSKYSQRDLPRADRPSCRPASLDRRGRTR